VSDVVDRASALRVYADETAGCTRCVLAGGRTQVVFGAGNPDAELMFVGEAPGFHEDQQGIPFVGQAGKLLDKLLAGIGLERSDVYIANTLKCRPPGNRDPMPEEIAACEPHLFRQIELIQPNVVATLGNFATKLLSGKPLGITRVHGQPQEVALGPSRVILYPLYHPAAALYTPSMLTVLEQDFGRIPELLARAEPAPPPGHEAPATAPPAVAEPVQLGLF
jgi:uracil-DNA glycosylase family 4